MSRKQKFKPAVAVANRADDPYITSGAGSVQSDKFWRWGDDNLFPNALALMARRSVTHRRIINDKADYISGKLSTPPRHGRCPSTRPSNGRRTARCGP